MVPEELQTQVAVSMIQEVFKSDWKTVGELLNWGQGASRDYDFSEASREYGKRIIERYGRIRRIGAAEAAPLLSVFVAPDLLHKITVHHSLGLRREGGDALKERPSFGQVKEEKGGALDVIGNHRRLVVLGKPGAGKTCLLQYVAVQAVQDGLPEKRLPVFIDLKDYVRAGCESVQDYVIREFEVCRFPDVQPFVIHLLKKGRLLLLFDGVDEIEAPALEEAQRQIEQFVCAYDQARVILACNTADYNSCFPRFSVAELVDFDERRIESFTKKWFKKDKEGGGKFLGKLFMPGNERVRKLAGTPLFLSLLCLGFDERADFPQNRAELYKHATETLLRKWDPSRSHPREEVYRYLSARRKHDLFSQVAVQTFACRKYLFESEELQAYLDVFLRNVPDTAREDSESVLQAIEAQHGILISRGNGTYAFAHVSLQEYFAARYIVDHAHESPHRMQRLGLSSKDGEEPESPLDILAGYVTDPGWREIFLLVAGMLTPADDLIVTMKKKADRIVSGTKAKKLMDWAGQKAEGNQGRYRKAAVRAFYISLALDRDRDRDRAFDRSLMLARSLGLDLDSRNIDLDLALDRALALSLARTFARALALAAALALARDLDRDRDHAIGLARDLCHDLDLALECALDSACDCADKLKTASLARTLTGLKESIPKQTARQQRWFGFAQELQKAMITYRDLGYEFNLSLEELDEIENYLYVNKMIVECLQADCYVDREIRERVLSELVTL